MAWSFGNKSLYRRFRIPQNSTQIWDTKCSLSTGIAEQKKLKQLKHEFLNLPAAVEIYVNESLCP